MADLDQLESNGDEDNIIKDNIEGAANDEELTQFHIESEDVLDEDDRERWHKDAEKYESIIDKLFDENEHSDPVET